MHVTDRILIVSLSPPQSDKALWGQMHRLNGVLLCVIILKYH